MKTPLQELMEYMEQNQYFIGNDLLAKYKELIEEEKELIKDAYECNNEICSFKQWQQVNGIKL
jgi:hypothetical protein